MVYGAPQGIVFGHVLFLIYKNWIKALSLNGSVFIYADPGDIALVYLSPKVW